MSKATSKNVVLTTALCVSLACVSQTGYAAPPVTPPLYDGAAKTTEDMISDKPSDITEPTPANIVLPTKYEADAPFLSLVSGSGHYNYKEAVQKALEACKNHYDEMDTTVTPKPKLSTTDLKPKYSSDHLLKPGYKGLPVPLLAFAASSSHTDIGYSGAATPPSPTSVAQGCELAMNLPVTFDEIEFVQVEFPEPPPVKPTEPKTPPADKMPTDKLKPKHPTDIVSDADKIKPIATKVIPVVHTKPALPKKATKADAITTITDAP